MKISQVQVGEEEGLFMLALRGHDDEDALLFQLSSELGDQDEILGMDAYSISSGTGATVYGGVASAAAAEAVVSLTLREDAAHSLGMPPVLRLEFPNQEAMAAAVAGLRQIGVVVRTE